MYGNNIGGPYMMPNNMAFGPAIGNSMMRGAPMMGIGTRGGGLSSLLGLGRGARGATALAGAGTHSFNLGNLLNGASKALGVVNQAIPIVKEVGPMMNNMRSMLKIASIFKDETDSTSVKTVSNTGMIKENENTSIKENSTSSNSTIVNSRTNDNEPNFFL